ncbi:hypothetical protein F442_02652 [Phytophthora nicotianae P10297]|uniref:Acetyl-CoA carboxylase central domain-containing protein n=1 Tax=Phytophthora nicotianae P10297 TaxID=1317064 RepID=W2ZZ72_PHYNI|nr:hypothetical protein F442_02652 [Phytophthora nicotianae P10297]
MVKLPSSENTNGNSIKSVHKMHKSLAVLKSVLQGPGHRGGHFVVGWPYPAGRVAETLDEKKKTLDMDQKRSDFEASVLRLRDIARKYKHGLRSGEEAVLTDLINEYFTVETVYVNSHNIEDVVMALRQQIPSDLDKVFSIVLSNKALESKNKLLLQLLAQMARGTPLLAGGSAVVPRQSQPLFDLLISLLDHEDQKIRELALELYAQRGAVRRNSSASSLTLGEHNSEESNDDQETVDKPLPKPVESYQKISPDFEFVVGAQRPSCQCASRDSGGRALEEGEPAGTGRDVPRVSGPEPPPAQHPPRDLFGAPVEHREYLDHNADMALYPNIYTFPGRLNYSEDKIVRRMEAPIAYKLELRRLQTYNVKEWIASRVANLRQEDGVLKVPNTLEIMHHLDGKLSFEARTTFV